MIILMSINYNYVLPIIIIYTHQNCHYYNHANNTRTTNNSFIPRHLDRLKVWVKFTTSLQVVYNV